MIGAKGFGERLAKRLREHAQAQLATATLAATRHEMRPVHLAVSTALAILADVIIEVTE